MSQITTKNSKATPFAFSIGFFLLSLLGNLKEIHATDTSQTIQSEKGAGGTTSFPYDLKFIDELTAHHNDGIQMSELAVQRTQSPELREMAQKMVTDQQSEIQKLSGFRERWYADSPEHVDRTGSMQSPDLMAATGMEFDRKFLDAMIEHHPGAIYLGLEAIQRARHSEIRKLGRKTADTQIKELNDMRKMRNSK